MIEIVKTRITENTKIAEGTYYLKLELPFSYPRSIPGQFVNIYLNNESKLLPRPISIFDHKDGQIHLIYAVMGEGTEELSVYRPKTTLRISTPLGNGFRIPDFNKRPGYGTNEKNAENIDGGINYNNYDDSIVLVGGGFGIAPLHYTARIIHNKYSDSTKAPDIYAVLGYRAEPFLNENFEKYCKEVQVCSENPSDQFADCWIGNVIIPINECKYHEYKNIMACGPNAMLKALNDLFDDRENTDYQVSMEERMGCGFGTCVGCSIELKEKNTENIIRKKVCKDGPVFKGSEVVW